MNRENIFQENVKLCYIFKILKEFFKGQKFSRVFQDFKGYLRYKTITSQNVSSEAQVKNFFIS